MPLQSILVLTGIVTFFAAFAFVLLYASIFAGGRFDSREAQTDANGARKSAPTSAKVRSAVP